MTNIASNTGCTQAVSGNSAQHIWQKKVIIEGVSERDVHIKGDGVTFRYGFSDSFFGSLFFCWTEKGLHRLYLIEPTELSSNLEKIQKQWPHGRFIEDKPGANLLKDQLFSFDETPIKLWLKGTHFQVSVWKNLLDIPFGKSITYQHLAEEMGNPKACRAIGNAIGANPIALLIPCHRIVQKSGALGGYRWGVEKKRQALNHEKQITPSPL